MEIEKPYGRRYLTQQLPDWVLDDPLFVKPFQSETYEYHRQVDPTLQGSCPAVALAIGY